MIFLGKIWKKNIENYVNYVAPISNQFENPYIFAVPYALL